MAYLEPKLPQIIGPLAPGENSVLVVDLGAAPPPGRYIVTVKSRPEGGRIREFLGWQQEESSTSVLRVWQDWDERSVGVKEQRRGARLLRRLSVGQDAPFGLGCEASFMTLKELRIGVVEFEGGTRFEEFEHSFEWNTGPLEAFSERNFSLFVKAPKQEVSWPGVAGDLEIECDFLAREGGG